MIILNLYPIIYAFKYLNYQVRGNNDFFKNFYWQLFLKIFYYFSSWLLLFIKKMFCLLYKNLNIFKARCNFYLKNLLILLFNYSFNKKFVIIIFYQNFISLYIYKNLLIKFEVNIFKRYFNPIFFN